MSASRTRRRLAACLATAAAVAAVAPAAAPAATLAVEGTTLRYAAAPGEINGVAIIESDGTYDVYEEEADVTTGPGCGPALPTSDATATCTGPVASIRIELGDRDDYGILEEGATPITILGALGDDFLGGGEGQDSLEGGEGADELDGWFGNDTLLLGPGDNFGSGGGGDDVVTGETGNDVLLGGDGADTLTGAAGSDVLSGDDGEDPQGDGADTLDGGPDDDALDGDFGPDRIVGGADFDLVGYSLRSGPVTVRLDGAANDGADGEADDVSGDVEDVYTGDGNDVVVGSGGPNVIFTGAGDDQVDPSGGADVVETDVGNDQVAARDGAPDRIGCGPGADSASVDDGDTVAPNCDAIDRLPGPGTPGGPGATPGGGTAQGGQTPSRVAPSGLTATPSPRRDRRAPFSFRVRGRLALPSGAPANACAGGVAIVSLRRGTRTLDVRIANLDASCRFTTRLAGGRSRSRSLRIAARFPGNGALLPARSRTARVRSG